MDEHTSHEQAFKNGYDKGYADGKRDAVKVEHGFWIDSKTVDHQGRITGHGIDCSVCDSVFNNDRRDVVQHWKERFKVCPFCGAIMDGGDDYEG